MKCNPKWHDRKNSLVCCMYCGKIYFVHDLGNIECDAPRGLGDSIENLLSKHGITQERWISFKRKISFGYFGKNCACERRKKFLNWLWPYVYD